MSGTSNETAGNPFPPETGDIFLRHSSFLPRVFQVPLLLSRRRPIWRIPSFSDCRGTSPRHPLTGGISFVFHQYYITLKRNVLPQNRKKSVRFQSKLKKTVEKDDRKSRRPHFSGGERKTARANSTVSGAEWSLMVESHPIPLRRARFFIHFLGRPHLVIHRLDAVAVTGVGAQPAAEEAVR